MVRLDGKAVAQARQVALRTEIEAFSARFGRAPSLAVVLVGDNPASRVYVGSKEKTCTALGMTSLRFDLPGTTPEREIIAKVQELNADPNVDAILVQLPLPKGVRENAVIDSIAPEKDPDGLTYQNLGLLMAGRRRVAPCTPWGVMAILAHYGIALEGKRAVVVGRSNIVGKPMAQLLLEANATVTICHSKTPNLEERTREADIVVVAAGRERLLGKSAFKQGAVVIDVGIHRPTTGPFAGKLCGDVRYDELEGWASAATPVPGGVGPMTIQMLMENALALAKLRA